MTVKDIVSGYLHEHGFDGLCTDGCGCGLRWLFECEEARTYCIPAYFHKIEAPDGGLYQQPIPHGFYSTRRRKVKAIDVLNAAKKTFEACGNYDYSQKKADSFLRRCGVRIKDGHNQEVELDKIKNTVYAMLDAQTENLFWKYLEEN